MYHMKNTSARIHFEWCWASERKDYSITILKISKSANRLVLDETTNDDNFIITLHLNTMDMLQLFLGTDIFLAN